MPTIESLFPWIAVLFGVAFAYPWARWLLDLPYAPGEARPRQPVLTLIVTVGLSLGALTWLMMMLMALSSALLRFGVVTVVALLVSGGGWIAWWRRRRDGGGSVETTGGSPRYWLAAMLVVGIAGLILLNAAFWPFLEDDTLSLYGPRALRIATTGAFDLAPDQRSVYDAYPTLVPLAFAYPHLAAGAPHEYTARLIVAILAVGAVGAAYALGQELYDSGTGLLAAFVTVTTPILTHWAAAGYTDLPAGTYYALATLFAWRLFRRPHPAYAVLTGLLAGLAVFTKNGAWLLVGALAGWIVYTHWAARRAADADGRAISRRHVLAMAAAFLLVAGPWYAHTLLTYGYLVPPTGWTQQAVRDPLRLAADLLTSFGHFALNGPIVVVGMPVALWQLWRSRWTFAPRLALLIGFSAPFVAVWEWYFSYDFRFLLMIWPLLALLGAAWLMGGFRRLPPGAQTWLARALPIVALLLALPAALMAVDHKPELLRNPFMSDLERHQIQLGPRYDLVLWLRETVPTNAWILSTDYHIIFYLTQSHPFTVHRASQARDYVRQFDIWVVGPGIELPDWANADTLRLLREMGGYRAYAVFLPPAAAES